MGKMRNAYQFFVERYEGNNIEKDLKETGCKDLIYLARDRV
jgi:hypothetical protein